jgi:hypothetical protein
MNTKSSVSAQFHPDSLNLDLDTGFSEYRYSLFHVLSFFLPKIFIPIFTIFKCVLKMLFLTCHGNPSTIAIFLATAAFFSAKPRPPSAKPLLPSVKPPLPSAKPPLSLAKPPLPSAKPPLPSANSPLPANPPLQSEKHPNHHQNQHHYPQSHRRRCFNDRCHLRRHYQSHRPLSNSSPLHPQSSPALY